MSENPYTVHRSPSTPVVSRPPSPVRLKRGALHDGARDNREVPYKIYYPETEESVPVIIWSHGFGGSMDGASFIARHLAGQGYMVFHPTHRGTDSSLWEGRPGHPWDILRDYKVPREDSLHRFKDIPFVVDQLPALAEEHGIHIDINRLGMSGHSFGALTTQVIAGQLFPDENEELVSMDDDRFKAFIAYSPVPIGHLYHGEEDKIYAPIRGPILFATGTEDHSPLDEFGYERRLKIHELSEAEMKELHILDGGDHMVYNGTRGKLGNNPDRDKHETEILQVTTDFWSKYL